MTDEEALKVAVKVTRQAAEFCAVGSQLEADYTEAAAQLERLARFVEAALEYMKYHTDSVRRQEVNPAPIDDVTGWNQLCIAYRALSPEETTKP